MIRINLLPTKANRKKESALFQIIVGAVAVLLAVIVCLVLNHRINGKIQAERNTITELDTQINRLKQVIVEVEEFKKKRRDLEAKINTIKELNEKRSGPVKLMDEFTFVLPRKAWITTFREVEKQLTLEGVAVDGPTVADFVDNLRNSKFFYNVQLIQIQQTTEAGKKNQRFSINCVVNYTAGKA